jgi:hypothetical protein
VAAKPAGSLRGGASHNLESTPPHPDRDLEFRSQFEPRSVGADPFLDLEEYQRLVTNPFLGLLALLAWLIGVRWVLLNAPPRLWLPSLLLTLVTAPALPFLFQYHCRDCGASGPLHRWRKHLCPPVQQRRRSGQPRRFKGPSPSLQLVIWLYFLLLIGVLASMLGWQVPRFP